MRRPWTEGKTEQFVMWKFYDSPGDDSTKTSRPYPKQYSYIFTKYGNIVKYVSQPYWTTLMYISDSPQWTSTARLDAMDLILYWMCGINVHIEMKKITNICVEFETCSLTAVISASFRSVLDFILFRKSCFFIELSNESIKPGFSCIGPNQRFWSFSPDLLVKTFAKLEGL